ncbi:hypothetical protein Tco_0242650 [Tanacetum coccineum]
MAELSSSQSSHKASKHQALNKQTIVGNDCLRELTNRVKIDMVKREVEIETVGECVDEIDKLAELIGKHEADQHW